eukprot:6482207-Amphidinium_carterae.3
MHCIGDSRQSLHLTLSVGTVTVYTKHMSRMTDMSLSVLITVSTLLLDDFECGRLPLLLCDVRCKDMGSPGFS